MLQLWDGHKLLSQKHDIVKRFDYIQQCVDFNDLFKSLVPLPPFTPLCYVSWKKWNDENAPAALHLQRSSDQPAALYSTAATWPGSGGGYVPIPARHCCWCCCCGLLAPALTDTMTVYVCFTPLPWRSVKQTHPVPIKHNRKSAGYSFAVCQKAKTDINKIKYTYARA